MLHAFELGLLSEEDRLGFEEHLLDCGHCFAQVEELLAVSQSMQHDPDVRPGPEEIKSPPGKPEQDESVTEPTQRSRTRFTRLVAIAAVLIVAALPVYWISIEEPDPGGPVQEINLMPIRGGSPPVLYLDEGGTAEIRFLIEGIESDADVMVRIVNRDGSVIYEAGFSDVADTSGNGTLTLPMSGFEPGFYKLVFHHPHDTAAAIHREYNFRVR
jgi:hypothetical protein